MGTIVSRLATEWRRLVPQNTQQCRSPGSSFRFLDLPLDIRLMIYEELLVVGKIFYDEPGEDDRPPPRHGRRAYYRSPNLNILRVCKRIHHEAEEVYLAKNLFVLPLFWQFQPPFSTNFSTNNVYWNRKPAGFEPITLFSEYAKLHLRNVSIAVDLKDLVVRGMEWRVDAKPFACHRLVQAHNVMLENLATDDKLEGCNWYTITNAIKDLIQTRAQSKLPGLRYIEINFERAYCPMACCRPLHLFDFSWITHTQAEIWVIGLKAEELQPMFTRMRQANPSGRILSLYQHKKIRFRLIDGRGEADPWANCEMATRQKTLFAID